MANTKRRGGIITYVVGDFVTAAVSWALFFLFRKSVLEQQPIVPSIFEDSNFYFGILIIPIGWVLFYAIFDSYRNIYRMSRVAEFGRTLALNFFGVIFLFFVLILDDVVYYSQASWANYYIAFFVLFLIHFFITVFVRMFVLTRASRRIKSGAVSFNTLLVGGKKNALTLYNEITSRKKALGYRFVGFIDSNGNSKNEVEDKIPKLGKLNNIPSVIKEHQIEEVIIAIETSEHDRVKDILNTLYGMNVLVKIIPDMYDILLGSVKMSHVFGAVLIEVRPHLMTNWQKLVKRTIDILVSLFVMILFSPLYLYIALRVKFSSKGPIFFKQDRIGLNGKPFKIYKFRSMTIDAEKNGPQLSNDEDDRCTPWGRIMRKYRLDELPQFWNVLLGEMSLVGPRPERQFYIDQIMEKASHFQHLLKVRPGITSWGQVKYGYASNVEEMIQRLKFDILYIENFSLALDLKIIIYTVLVILQGKGK